MALSEKLKQKNENFALEKDNYVFLAIGFVIIIIGFLLMIGGKSEDPKGFSEAIFSFRRITLAPIIVLLGFAFEIWAIMRRPKSKNQDA